MKRIATLSAMLVFASASAFATDSNSRYPPELESHALVAALIF